MLFGDHKESKWLSIVILLMVHGTYLATSVIIWKSDSEVFFYKFVLSSSNMIDDQ